MNRKEDIIRNIASSSLHFGDARNMGWIDSTSVDLVVTSPPYVCSQDYIKTMRLTNLFFPNEAFYTLPSKEIGPRSKRSGNVKKVASDFYSDMGKVFLEISRVLKPNRFFCLIIGQGKNKIAKSYDTINDCARKLTTQLGFCEVFRTERKISHKSVRVGGVDTENIIVFQKTKEGELHEQALGD
jgi:DNA modification methylase